MNELISIVIVNWNGSKWLNRCLNSLTNQTYSNLEVIVVDNGSYDNSIQLIKENYTKVKVIHNPLNVGFAQGNNIGINQAKGAYILLLNNDTWLSNDFIEKIMHYYSQHTFDVVAPRETDYFIPKTVNYNIKIDLLGHPIYSRKYSKDGKDNDFYLSGVCLFFSKKLYLETRGLDNNFFMYFEEIDWFWRLHLLKKKVSHVDSLFVPHAGAGSSGQGLKYQSFLWRNQNTLQMIIKNYYWYNLLWVLPLYFIQNIVEIVFFLVVFKPKISYSYLQGWWFNAKNLTGILERRAWVQHNRMVGDKLVLSKMYFGFAKLHHLLGYFGGQNG